MLTPADLEIVSLTGLPSDEYHRDEGAAWRLLEHMRTLGWSVTVTSHDTVGTWHVGLRHVWRGRFHRAEAPNMPIAAVAAVRDALGT